jgi:hypothetical protein
MIIIRDAAGGARRAPPWFPETGFAERETVAGRLFALCDPLLLDAPARTDWRDLDDQWQIAVVGKPDVDRYRRDQTWLKIEPCTDSTAALWFAPRVLTAQGNRNFAVPFGRNWIPAPRPEQAALLDVARAARDELVRGATASAGESFGIPIEAAFNWAATLLSAVYHLPPEAFAALALIDEVLALTVLRIAAGLDQVEQPAAPDREHA